MTIVQDDKMAGEPRLEGRRITVLQVVTAVEDFGSMGATADQLRIDEDEVREAVEWARANPEWMDDVRADRDDVRHSIIQTILGHPQHLASVEEIGYFMPDSSGDAIEDGIEGLVDDGILEVYECSENREDDLPWRFFGPTEYGVHYLEARNYLRGVPLVRAIIKRTETTGRIERVMTAPRPDLPDDVRAALRVDEKCAEWDGGAPTDADNE